LLLDGFYLIDTARRSQNGYEIATRKSVLIHQMGEKVGHPRRFEQRFHHAKGVLHDDKPYNPNVTCAAGRLLREKREALEGMAEVVRFLERMRAEQPATASAPPPSSEAR
jgi:hypothetical protein